MCSAPRPAWAKRIVGARIVEAERHGVVVDHFELARRARAPTPISVLSSARCAAHRNVHDVGGGDRSPVEVELGILVQMEGPGR
jgi:hypothetical protein